MYGAIALTLRAMRQTIALICSLCVYDCSAKAAPEAAPTEKPGEAQVVAVETDAASAEEPASADSEAATEIAPAPKVTVVSKGEEPRHVLRWRFKKGQTQTIVMLLDMAIEVSVNGESRPRTETPPMEMVMDARIEDITPDDVGLVRFEITKVTLNDTDKFPETMVSQIEASLDGITDIKGSYHCDRRGFVTNVDIVIPDDAKPAVRKQAETLPNSIRQMVSPLPEEAVGNGAKWTVESTLEVQGIKANQVATISVKRMGLPMLDVAADVDQRAGAQTIVEGGQTVTMNGLRSKASGDATWNLDALAPGRANSRGKTQMSMTVPGQNGTEIDVLMVIDLGMRLSAPERR